MTGTTKSQRMMFREAPTGETQTPQHPVATNAMGRPTIVSVMPPSRPAEKTNAPPPPGAVTDPISHYIDLEIEARKCTDLDALRFAIVNSTRKIAAFDQAFLAEPSLTGGWSVTRAASVSKIDRHAPLVRAITAWLEHPRNQDIKLRNEPRLPNIEKESRDWNLDSTALMFPHALWLPLTSRKGDVLGALIALKKENWRPQQTALMIPLAGAYAHAWDALQPRTGAPIPA
jgi:hypothetical protein